jgi:predicted Zn-dependent protease
MRDILRDVIEDHSSRNDIILRYFELEREVIVFDYRYGFRNVIRSEQGLCCVVCVNGLLGQANTILLPHSNCQNSKTIFNLIRQATKLAELSNSRFEELSSPYRNLEPHLLAKGRFCLNTSAGVRTETIESKQEHLLETIHSLDCPKAVIHYARYTPKKVVVTNYGADSEYIFQLNDLLIYTQTDSSSINKEPFINRGIGSLSQFLSPQFYTKISNHFQKKPKTQEKTTKKVPKKGIPIISPPIITQMIVHEVFGHPSEDPTVAIKPQKANPLITIIDDGALEYPGLCPTDDEGIKASRTVLIKDGIRQSYLYDCTTALFYQRTPTGNSRVSADNSFQPSKIRMTNTFMEPKQMDPTELFDDINEALVLVKAQGGNISLSGIVTFHVKGYIWNKFGPEIPVKGTLNFHKNDLLSLDIITNEFEMAGYLCAKSEQRLYVANGGSSIRFKAKLLG